jgi:hypothetical protein
MKKTLIALAALGVVGAASAQVTISGDLSYGYATKKDAGTSVVTQGFGMRSSNITFGVSEDLGGGLSIKGSAGMDSVRGNNSITGNSASLTLSGGFGTLTLNAGEEICNGIVGQAAGANIDDMDIGFDCVASDAADNFIYALPAMGAFSAKVLVGNDTGGYGAGTHSGTTYYLNYADGPVKAGVDLTSYPSATGKNNRTRMTASYDAGMAVISLGSSKGGVTSGNKADQTVWGVSVPMGATTIGVGYGSHTSTAKVAATGVNVTYALSKSTTLTFTSTNSNATAAAAMKKRTEVYLKKAF